ncbi:MAG: lipopolysaccharide heptosyltransferase II [Bacteroidetes bacterium]|nr:lipopolysaccharide heptosyltransferase II [Bacteroidota bacterium]
MSEPSLRKVLVLRLSSIGDVILATPMLRAIKRRFPECLVDMVTRREFGELLTGNPHIDRLHLLDTAEGRAGLRALNLALMSERYDAVFDLHNNFRSRTIRNGLSSNVHIIRKRGVRRLLLYRFKWNTYREIVPVPERYMETTARYGVKADAEGPRLYPDDGTRLSARLKLRAAGADPARPSVGLCPGAMHFTKRWPAEHFVGLARLLVAEGERLLLLGGTADHEAAAAIARLAPEHITDLTGRLTLMETAAAMEYCRVVVANDSGLMHMATAMSRPVVALFGGTVREFGFFPYHASSVVLEVEGLRCRPCSHIGRDRCPEGHFACLRGIVPGDVVTAIRTHLPAP